MLTARPASEIAFENVAVVHYDPSMRMRTLMRGMLLTTGFREIRECRNIDDIAKTLRAGAVDLLLVDIDNDTDEICKLVRDIREGVIGQDPYVVIMAMTWNPEQVMIKRTLQAGTDDLIAKPISPKVLIDRTNNLVRNRRDFVVTTTYIGPDRRSPERATPGDLPTIKVPNALRHKAVGDAGAAPDVGALTAARELIRQHRIFRMAAQIGEQTLKLENEMAESKSDALPATQFAQIAELVAHANTMIAEDELTELKPIGLSMANLINAIAKAGRLDKRQFAILRLHSQAVAATIKDDQAAAEMIGVALGRAVEVIGKTTPQTAPQSPAKSPAQAAPQTARKPAAKPAAA